MQNATSIRTALYLALFSCLLSACTDPAIRGIADTDINIVVRTADGKNLLDSTTAGYFNPTDIRLYTFRNGLRTELSIPRLAVP